VDIVDGNGMGHGGAGCDRRSDGHCTTLADTTINAETAEIAETVLVGEALKGRPGKRTA
jgi:hypothetical protein